MRRHDGAGDREEVQGVLQDSIGGFELFDGALCSRQKAGVDLHRLAQIVRGFGIDTLQATVEVGKARLQALESMPGVEACVPILKPFKLASREVKKENSVVDVGLGVTIGAGRLAVMAGPCSVESEQQVMESARAVKAG